MWEFRKEFRNRKKGKSLGVAKETRRYDLPLDKGSGNLFLKTLVALMTFLAMLGLASIFALSAMTDRWSSGLENKASIEIPAEDVDGTIISKDILENITTEAFNLIKAHPAVENAQRMDDEDIIALISPWLGNDMQYENFPLPGIISVSFKDDVVFDIESLELQLKGIAPQVKLDTHESWLRDVLRFTGALNFAAVLITLIIGITTIVAVAGAVQSRMAVYREELELLHLMGAGDKYISNQLQRYMLILSMKGAVIGALIGGAALMLVGLLAGEMDVSLLPDFRLSWGQITALFILPLLVGVLAMVTARQTVLRVLVKMP